MMGGENTKHNIQNSLTTRYTAACPLFTLWSPGRLDAASRRRHDRGSCCLLLVWRKTNIPNSKYGFCFNNPLFIPLSDRKGLWVGRTPPNIQGWTLIGFEQSYHCFKTYCQLPSPNRAQKGARGKSQKQPGASHLRPSGKTRLCSARNFKDDPPKGGVFRPPTPQLPST